MKEKKSGIRRFFGLLWNTVVTVYRVCVLLLIVIGVVMIWSAIRGGPAPTVENGVALVIWPTGDVVEQLDQDPTRELLQNLSGEAPPQTRLQDMIDALDAAAKDPRIKAVVLKFDDMGNAGLAQMTELTAAIDRFKKSGKPVLVHAVDYSQAGYFASSAADTVMLDPEGLVLLTGFGVYQNYFKDALDKLGVTVNVFRVGEYKSAVEPFLRNDMSPQAREANMDWLGDLWGDYQAGVSEHRKLDADAVQKYVDGLPEGLQQLDGDSAKLALQAKLVTDIGTLQQFREKVANVVGWTDDGDTFRQIHFLDYLHAINHEGKLEEGTDSKSRVAVVAVEGEIVDGDGKPGQAGGDTVSALLKDARDDDDVSAVVLRVNSPGGSVWAAEEIRRQVQALRAAGKPVVASMSTMAASGGYWVSMDAAQIWAEPSTITGSIGIFGMVPSIDKPLEKLGVHTDGVGTTKLSGGNRIDRPMSDEMKTIQQALVNRGYQQFIGGVAQARQMTVEQVNEIARGRVWSGEDAKKLGLVDEFGGLQQAAAAAAKLAGLKDGEWKMSMQEPAHPLNLRLLQPLLSGGMVGEIGHWLPSGVLSDVTELLAKADVSRSLDGFNDPHGLYARCFCEPDDGGH